MLLNKFAYFMILMSSIVSYSMDSLFNKNILQILKKNSTKKSKSYLEMLPHELIEHVRDYYMSHGYLENNKNFKKSIEDFKKFNLTVAKICGTDYKNRNFDVSDINVFSKCFDMSPFIIARMLKLQIPEDLKIKFEKQVIEKELKKYGISKDNFEKFKAKNSYLLTEPKSLDELFSLDFIMKMLATLQVCKITQIEKDIALLIETDRQYQSFRSISILLNIGANPNIINTRTGETPIINTIKKNQNHNSKVSIVKILIEAGADLNCRDQKNKTPLILALQRGKEREVALLIENGADVNIQDAYDHTALLYAISAGMVKIAKLLLDAGANPYKKTAFGNTALSMAKLARLSDEKRQEMLDLLKSYGVKDSNCIVS